VDALVQSCRDLSLTDMMPYHKIAKLAHKIAFTIGARHLVASLRAYRGRGQTPTAAQGRPTQHNTVLHYVM
jgi:hypothetical protein